MSHVLYPNYTSGKNVFHKTAKHQQNSTTPTHDHSQHMGLWDISVVSENQSVVNG